MARQLEYYSFRLYESDYDRFSPEIRTTIEHWCQVNRKWGDVTFRILKLHWRTHVGPLLAEPEHAATRQE